MAKSAVFFVFLMLASLTLLSVNAESSDSEKSNPCICASTDDINHVCGSDGVTYINLSLLECANKCKKSGDSVIRKVKEGQC